MKATASTSASLMTSTKRDWLCHPLWVRVVRQQACSRLPHTQWLQQPGDHKVCPSLKSSLAHELWRSLLASLRPQHQKWYLQPKSQTCGMVRWVCSHLQVQQSLTHWVKSPVNLRDSKHTWQKLRRKHAVCWIGQHWVKFRLYAQLDHWWFSWSRVNQKYPAR